jgi:hypothetical protein
VCVRDPLGTCCLYQGGDLDFLQVARLREQTGKKLGLLTGGKTARTNRVEAGTSYREQSCENKQGRGWDISRGVDLRRIPVRLDDLKSLRHSRCLAGLLARQVSLPDIEPICPLCRPLLLSKAESGQVFGYQPGLSSWPGRDLKNRATQPARAP